MQIIIGEVKYRNITYIVGVGRRITQCSSESYIDPEIGGISMLKRGRIQNHLLNLTNKFYAGDKCRVYVSASNLVIRTRLMIRFSQTC